LKRFKKGDNIFSDFRAGEKILSPFLPVVLTVQYIEISAKPLLLLGPLSFTNEFSLFGIVRAKCFKCMR
tara:strand:+ start:543 stop:749 length:207 start_codon:yes stop_codon:yes gene_type:complete